MGDLGNPSESCDIGRFREGHEHHPGAAPRRSKRHGNQGLHGKHLIGWKLWIGSRTVDRLEYARSISCERLGLLRGERGQPVDAGGDEVFAAAYFRELLQQELMVAWLEVVGARPMVLPDDRIWSVSGTARDWRIRADRLGGSLREVGIVTPVLLYELELLLEAGLRTEEQQPSISRDVIGRGALWGECGSIGDTAAEDASVA